MNVRGSFLHNLEAQRTCGHLTGGMDLICSYAGARAYLLARTDLYSDRNHDFIITSNWPFNLVRKFGASLVDSEARTSEVRRCLHAFEPSFQDIDASEDLFSDYAPRMCLIPFNAGQARMLLGLLFAKDVSLSHDRLRDVALATAYYTSHYPEIVSSNNALSDLTVREIECLSWIGEGKTSDEIALIIGISRNTVNNYITSIMNKTGAKTRSEAVAFAVRQRII